MMDIVDRLRTVDISWSLEGELCAEAADYIQQLHLELAAAKLSAAHSASWAQYLIDANKVFREINLAFREPA